MSPKSTALEWTTSLSFAAFLGFLLLRAVSWLFSVGEGFHLFLDIAIAASLVTLWSATWMVTRDPASRPSRGNSAFDVSMEQPAEPSLRKAA